jgi:hypothetical protein
MRVDVNDGMPNGTPKTLIPFDEVVNYDGVLKLGGRLEVTMLHIFEVG